MTAPTIQRDLLIVACAISAGIHGALAPEHFAEGAGAGGGFLAAAVVLAVLVLELTRRPERDSPVAAAALVLGGLIVSYLLVVTIGVPALHPEVEPVDGLALVTKAVEAAGLLAAIQLLRQGRAAVPLSLRLKGTPT